MSTSERWVQAINLACSVRDPALSNKLITRLHYLLSEELTSLLGYEGGPNFHSWAVWGSRKAGVTIRQEDLQDAISNATVTASIVGGLVGIYTGIIFGALLHWDDYFSGVIGATVGCVIGGFVGRTIAIWSRKKAACLILEGNRVVIRDIGEQSARFIELLENSVTSERRERFFAGLRPGPTEQGGQDRLTIAFRFYLQAFESDILDEKRSAMIKGNCEIVYHEHIKLEPFIRNSMPVIVRRCATQRMMTFEIGREVFTVGKNIPHSSTPNAAKNWAKISDRMRYVFALFQKFHNSAEVFSAPYSEIEMSEMRDKYQL